MSDSVDKQRLNAALEKVTKLLLAEMNSGGHWTGELSSSGLSTAVAVIALNRMGETDFTMPGLRWLAEHVNCDGGWGDTIRSQSNLSTTALVWAAFGATNHDSQFSAIIQKAEAWLWKAAGSREHLPEAIIACYGKDRTFSVPILMTLALSGRLGKDGWRGVLPLPFELAALPQSWFGALQLPVVSYALPALIAIGQTIHHHAPSKNLFARNLRDAVKTLTLRRLEKLQPTNGGFLEATPLTSFVTMSLASMGLQENVVAVRGASFLKKSMRADGSWPIDTNLATWLTTLAAKALAYQPPVVGRVAPRAPLLTPDQKLSLAQWLLGQQYQTTHPYTGAAPGGWAWTDLPGGVPDADDTAGALIALRLLTEPTDETIQAASKGVKWLLDLQNRDGGIPTFCKGWGTLPFDRSAPELTVHAMQAWTCWRPHLDTALRNWIDRAMQRAERFLAASQRSDGAWIPLWFGNETAPEQENRVYGTARTLAGLNELVEGGVRVNSEMLSKAVQFLRQTQLLSGGWGGDLGAPESLEEAALAAEALNDARGVNRVIELVEADQFKPTPIGLYFARLWYYEKLYPLIFAVSALGRASSKQL